MISLKDILKYKADLLELFKMAGYTNVRVYYNQDDIGTYELSALSFIVDFTEDNENSFHLKPFLLSRLLADKLGCYVKISPKNNLRPSYKEDMLQKSAPIENETMLVALSKEKSLEAMQFSLLTSFDKEVQTAVNNGAVMVKEKLIKQYPKDEKLKQILEKNFSLTNSEAKSQNKEEQIFTSSQQADSPCKRKNQKLKEKFCEISKQYGSKNGFFSSKNSSQKNGKFYLKKLEEKKQQLSTKTTQKNSALKPNS